MITRLYQTDYADDNLLLKTKYCIGGNYEIEEDAEGNQRKLHYLSAGSGLFAIFVQDNEGEHMYYIHKDYLGSFQSITDENGELVENLSFDPWGRRRNADDWSFSNVPEDYLFDRGYTGHEHLDNFGLINMNGRVYDPFVARFLSPDPFVSNPTGTQGFNRYSYVSNNPLKYVDPSGYIEKPTGWDKPVISIIPFGPGVTGSIGPGSGNHWSDEYNHNPEFYFAFSSRDSFDAKFGEGSFDLIMEYQPKLSDVGSDGFWSYVENDNSYSIDQGVREYEGSNMIYMISPLSGPEVILRFIRFGNDKNGDIGNAQNSGGEEFSTNFIAGTTWAGVVAGAKEGYNIVNNEAIRQGHYNNSIRKPGVPLDDVTSLKVPNSVKVIGKYGGLVFTFYGAYDIDQQWRNSEISTGTMMIEQISNGMGAIPAYGTGWSIGWNLGKSYGPSTWYGKNDYKWFE